MVSKQGQALSILLGVTAAVGWGMASFLVRFVTRAIGAVSAVLVSQTMGLLIMSVYVFGSGEFATRAAVSHWQWWAWAVLAATCHTCGLVMAFRALEVGTLSIVAPISGSYAAVTVTLSYLSGERLSLFNLIGVMVALVGVVLVSRRKRGQPADIGGLVRGVPFALGAALAFGTGYWLLGFRVAPNLGSVVPVFVVRLSSVVWVSLFFILSNKLDGFKLPPRSVWWFIIGSAICANIAYVANNTGYAFGNVGTVSLLSSMNSAVAVMLAATVLRERLRVEQWVGVACVLTGIVLLSQP